MNLTVRLLPRVIVNPVFNLRGDTITARLLRRRAAYRPQGGWIDTRSEITPISSFRIIRQAE